MFLETTAPESDLTEVKPALVRQFLTETLKKNSAATANHNRAVLFRMFKFLVREGFVKKNPIEHVDKLREDRKIIKTLTPTEVDKLINACNPRTFAGLRDRALMTLLYDTGLRISEALTLTDKDINLTNQTIKVAGKGGKERLVPFGQSVRKMLSLYLSRRGMVEGTDLLFVNCYGGQLDRNDVAHAMKRHAVRAGVQGDKATPHKFRHSFAVQFLRNGGDVFSLQTILGHATLEMTRRYVALAQSDVENVHRRYSPADMSLNEVKTGRKRIK